MRPCALALAIACAVWPAWAHATKPPEPSRAAGFGRVEVEGVEAAVQAEEVTFDCDETPHCTAAARWRLGATRDPARLSLVLERAELSSLELDGVALPFEASEHDGDPALSGPAKRVLAVLPPGSADRTLSATLDLRPTYGTGELFRSMVETRHVFVHRPRECTDVWYGRETSIPPRRHSLRVRRSRRLRRSATTISGGLETIPICTGRAWHGGPIIGIGAGFEPRARLRLRAGYELSSSRYTLHGLAVESDLRQVLAIPYTDVGTSNFAYILPSTALGVGVPLRAWPDFRAGMRVQLTLSWAIFSILGAFDAMPRMRDEPTAYYGMVLAQFGF